MSSPILALPESLAWKQAYMAAILEKDRSNINGRIEEAREKLSRRLREITLNGNPFPTHEEELEGIHEALYLLDALRSSLAYRDEGITRVEATSDAA